jgi:hypothetical protein
VANEWNKTAFVGFETMLRRHLRSGAAPVAACAGFDLDAASEYLEGALDEWRRASYESHLAGCAICRCHLIELARLAQAAPSFESRPAAAPDRIPARDRWKEVVAGWFDLSTWNLKWQIAGATGAAFAILIAALGVQSLRQAPSQADVAVSKASAASPLAAEPADQTFPSPTPAPDLSAQNAAVPEAEGFIANHQERPPIPPPSVRPVGVAPSVPVEPSSGYLALNSQPSEAPVEAKPGGAETAASPPPQTRAGAFIQLSDLSKGGESVLDGGQATKGNEIAGGPDISHPRFRGDLPGIKSESSSALQPKPLSQQALEKLRKMLTRSPVGKLGFSSDSERKEIPDTQESREDETANTLVWPWRGKVFRFEKGMWIDQEYKPEMQEWRLFALPRGSEEYKRALRDEPLLKEFFDKGPILIVWKNRIYKVLK